MLSWISGINFIIIIICRLKGPYVWKGNTYCSVIMSAIRAANNYKHEQTEAVKGSGRYSEVSIAVSTFAIKISYFTLKWQYCFVCTVIL